MSLSFREITYAPAVVSAVTGISPDMQRDWRRQQYIPANDGWAAYTLNELAAFYFVKLLLAAGFKPAQAWALADAEVTAAIVFHAAMVPGAIIDKTENRILTKRPTYIVKAAKDLTGRNAWAAKIYAWGPSLEPSAYASIEDASNAAAGERYPQVVSFLNLEEVGTSFAFRVEGAHTVLAVLEDMPAKPAKRSAAG